MNGNVLTAQCTSTGGQWIRSSINLSSCPGQLLGNNNGRLFCEGGGFGGNWGNLPAGSWRRSCTNARMSGDVVMAGCNTGHGLRQTSFHMRNCPGWALGNNNGNLFCESGNSGFFGGFPGGSWQNSCRAPSMQGNVLTATCSSTSGGWRTSRISMGSCPSRAVGNNNGFLFCERW
jgi:hypothetical protein